MPPSRPSDSPAAEIAGCGTVMSSGKFNSTFLMIFFSQKCHDIKKKKTKQKNKNVLNYKVNCKAHMLYFVLI